MKGEISSFVIHLAKEISTSSRNQLVTAHKPHATVVACSDARVSPELIFDAGLGKLFIIRTSGNVVGEFAIASVEYGVHNLGTPLLLLLGHQNCGTIETTKETGGKIEKGESGTANAIMNEIWPACEHPVKDSSDAIVLDAMVQENVRMVKKKIMKSKCISELINEKKLKIMLAEYYLDTGKVSEIADSDTDLTKICYGDTVVIKNLKTNLYLATESTNYEKETEHNIIFGSTKIEENTHWIIKRPHPTTHYTHGNPISEGDLIRLENVVTKKRLRSIPHNSKKAFHVSGYSVEGKEDEDVENWQVLLPIDDLADISLRVNTSFSLKHLADDHFLDASLKKNFKVGASQFNKILCKSEAQLWQVEKIVKKVEL